MSASKPTGWITARVPSSPDAAPAGALPIQVTDLKAVVRARGLVGDPIGLPAGRYLVTATSPDGRQWASCEAVEVVAGERQTVELHAEAQDVSAQPAPPSETAAADDMMAMDDAAPPSANRNPRNRMRGEPAALPLAPLAVWQGQWLQHWAVSGAGGAGKMGLLRRIQLGSPRGRDTVEVAPAGASDLVIEIPEGERSTYFAVPFAGNPGGTTTVKLTADVQGRPSARFGLGSAEIDGLVAFVIADAAESARTISAAIVRDAQDVVLERSQSPLLTAVASYVLLRANEFEGLDHCTEQLLAMAGEVLPDAQVLRAETLARLGRHREAVDVLCLRSNPRMPWFRSGVGYLEQRLELYLKSAEGGSGSLPLSHAQRQLCATILGGINRVSWAIDEATSFCVYRGLPRLEWDGLGDSNGREAAAS